MKKQNTATNTGSAAAKVEQNFQRARLIKLGVDAHADHYRVVRQIENGPLQPAQRFTPGKFLDWAQKQTALAERVVVCYEAGTFGFHPAREMEKRGVECLVMVPIKLDENNKRVNTDKLDAKRIAARLDRYLAGDKDALNIVRIPTPSEEEQRDLGRQRQTLVQDIKRMADRGRAFLRKYGHRIKGRWWEARKWASIEETLPKWMVEHLRRWVEIIQTTSRVLLEVHTALIAQAEKHLEGKPLPIGMGLLSYELLRLEVCDWNRFNNRRQVGSSTGLCPSENSSGPYRQQGSVTKHGNPLMRWVLVEMAWRLVRYQPSCYAVKRGLPKLEGAKAAKASRKKIIVSIARQLAVDLWRVNTGKATFEGLGYVTRGSVEMAA